MPTLFPRVLSVTLSASFGAALLSGCVYHHHHRSGPVAVVQRGGPPPWAPAHGYRHKHPHGVELVFDSGLGVYVVLGHPGCYFYRDRFLRYDDGYWRATLDLKGSWVVVRAEEVPAGLRGKHAKKMHPGRGGPPAKHGP
jgi:hypothetical protein